MNRKKTTNKLTPNCTSCRVYEGTLGNVVGTSGLKEMAKGRLGHWEPGAGSAASYDWVTKEFSKAPPPITPCAEGC